MNVILIFGGIVSGAMAMVLSSPTSISIGIILITTPLIHTMVDDMLIENWRQANLIFLLITAYISVSIWALSSFLNAASFQDSYRPSIIVTGFGFIQLVWIFLGKPRLGPNGAK